MRKLNQLAEAQRDRLQEILEANEWRIGHTAHVLGMTRVSVWRMMKKYGIRKPKRTHEV